MTQSELADRLQKFVDTQNVAAFNMACGLHHTQILEALRRSPAEGFRSVPLETELAETRKSVVWAEHVALEHQTKRAEAEAALERVSQALGRLINSVRENAPYALACTILAAAAPVEGNAK